LQLARPQSAIASSTDATAIALARENPKARLVFPTGVNPNHVEQKMFKTNKEKERDSNYSVGAQR